MQLRRIRDHAVARLVAQGVSRFNGISIGPNRVLRNPHYTILSNGQTAGWIGFENRGRGVYELAHLSVLPRFRRQGLAETAARRMLWLLRGRGGRRVYARIKSSNIPSRSLASKLGFRKTSGGRVHIYSRSL